MGIYNRTQAQETYDVDISNCRKKDSLISLEFILSHIFIKEKRGFHSKQNKSRLNKEMFSTRM